MPCLYGIVNFYLIMYVFYLTWSQTKFQILLEIFMYIIYGDRAFMSVTPWLWNELPEFSPLNPHQYYLLAFYRLIHMSPLVKF